MKTPADTQKLILDLVDRPAQLGHTHGARLVLAVRQDIPDEETLLGTLHG